MSSEELASLDVALRCWERVEYAGALAVLIGVIGEYIADFKKPWLRTPERVERVGKRSTLLLILGLSVELIALFRTTNLSDRLVEAERTARVHMESKLAKVRHETSLQRRWGREERQRHRERIRFGALHSQPRELVGEKRERFEAALRGKPTGSVSIAYLDKDDEVLALAVTLFSALKLSGWLVSVPVPVQHVGGWGLLIDAHSIQPEDWANSDTAQGSLHAAFVAALGAERLTGGGRNESLAPDAFQVTIGNRLTIR